MQKKNPLLAGLSILLLSLLLLSLSARYWVGEQGVRLSGPTHLAADTEQVFLVAANNIYHLSAAGELLAQHPLEVAGLQDIPIDLRITGGGRLLIASQSPARIQACDPDNWDCVELGSAVALRPQRQFKVLQDSSRNALLLTDAHGDSLRTWDLQDATSKTLLPENTLAGPNDLAFDQQGHLWVADTDKRRIVELIPTADSDWKIGRSHSAINEFTLGKRYYPMMLALGADGNWWVTQASEYSDGRADLVIYNPDTGAIGQVPLPGGVMATDVASMGEDIIVTDLETYTTYRVNSHSHSVATFGDKPFVLAMSELNNEKMRFERLGYAATAGVVIFAVLMVLAAIIATPKEKRWTQQPGVADLKASTTATPPVSGIYWLKRNERLDRQLKWLPRILSVLAAILLLSLTILYFWIKVEAGNDPNPELQSQSGMFGLLLLMTGLTLAVIIPLVNQSLNVFKNSLGTDGKQLYLRLNEGRQLAVSPSNVAYTKRAILYLQHTLPLQSGRNLNVYQKGELETWIAPLLHEAKNINEWQALKHQWKYHDFLLVWILGVGVTAAAAFIVWAQFRS